jgi:dynein heavy chain, axonemal
VANGVPDATAKFLEYVLAQIEAMVVIVRGDITGQQRTMLGAVITIDVHARDVTRTLARKAIDNLDNFEWSKQLR